MVIVRLSGGTGNQLFQYATGLRLALKRNTELKIDKINLDTDDNTFSFYTLDNFNIVAKPATPKEIAPLKEICFRTGLGMQVKSSLETVLNYPDNIYLHGDWCSESYFPDIRDVLLKQLTFKNPLSTIGEEWKQKILATDCSVSMHFRHGDFLYDPNCVTKPWFHIPPFDYYHNCVKLLKQQYKNLTVFVFSNNIAWIKDNLHLDVPTEFVEGWQDEKRFNKFFARDIEEMQLMSLCKHNINPRSAFSWWASYLNQNVDKKVFVSRSSTAAEVKKYQYSLVTNNNSQLESGKWIYVPFDRDNQPSVTMPPIFSLLLIVNDDAEILFATLDSLLNQDYKYYEVVIIDNASTDGSDEICRQAIKRKTNVTYTRLDEKISNPVAWNRALKLSQGKYVSFLKVGDRFLTNSLSALYWTARRIELVHMFSILEENDGGNLAFGDRRYSEQRDTRFKDEKRNSIISKDGREAARLLLDHEINSFLGTKLYNAEFLMENKIEFDETLDDEMAEIAFQKEAFLKTKYFMYLSKAFYVSPPLLKYRQPLIYQTHIAKKGWGAWINEEQVSNDITQQLDIQAIKINFPNHKVYYSVYYNAEEGWSEEILAPAQAGTTGKFKPIMGIRILLDETSTKEFNILYRVHKFDGEWTAWAKNGEAIYSYGQKLNAIQIKLTSKFNKNST